MAFFLPDTDSEDELPIGWEERVTLEGNVYYANHNLKITQWKHPKTGKRKKIAGKLPIDWENKIDQDGNLIYRNKETNKVTYTDPRLAFAVEQSDNFTELRQKFDSSATALQVLHGINLNDKVVIITGSNSGIGYETARSLALHGAQVIMCYRNLNKVNDAIKKILKEKKIAKLIPMYCDLSKLKTVKKFVDDFLNLNLPLHILILNAGVLSLPQTFTEDNIEITFQVNHLAHFYLAELLRNKLIESKPSRIVIVSSESHRFSKLNVSNLIEEKFTKKIKFFVPIMAYNDSKLCNLLFMHQYNLMYKNYGININAVHPGNLIPTNLSKNWWFYNLLFFLLQPFTKSLQQGAATQVYVATSPDLKNVIGCYFNNCTICEESKSAKDEILALNLWNLSKNLIKKKIDCNFS